MSRSHRRILVAGLYHETHSFVEERTGLEEFQVLRGDELWSVLGDSSPLAGVMETARDLDWTVIPALNMAASPGGLVLDNVVAQWWTELAGSVRAAGHGLDAIYLVLHGAMVSESIPDVEGEILSRIRALPGLEDCPLGGVTDLHANFSSRMARCSDALLTYRQNPHTDAKESAVRAARVLDDCLKAGQRPVTVWEHPPLMWPPTGTGTADNPMLALESLAREMEETVSGILAVNVHAGFSFADTPETGVSFSIITLGDPEKARAHLSRLTRLALELKRAGNPTDPPIEEVMPEVERLLSAGGHGPILLVEPSDNVGAGAPGDGTGVLRALIEHGTDNAAVVINDPGAVQALSWLAPGQRSTLPIGGKDGKGSRLSRGPVDLEIELLSTSDGRFELEDSHSHMASMGGARVNMGPCAVVRHRGIRILLTSRKTAPMDLGQLRSQGIQPESLGVIGVKAAVAHRRAYDPIARASFTVHTPGPCSSDLRMLPYRRVQRPIYPLDDLETLAFSGLSAPKGVLSA